MRTHFDFVKKQGGFSLAELLIYIAIVGIVAGLMTGIVSTVTRTQVEESAQNEVTGQLSFAMQTIQRLVRESSLIDLAAGTPTSTLLLYTRTGTTTIYLQNGKVYVRQGGGATPQAITSDTVVVDALEFKKFTQYPAKDVVQIDLALSNVTQASGRTVSRSLRGAVSRVSAATFDSDLLPGSDDSFKIGLTGGNRWEQGRFSKGISIGTAETYRTTSPPTGGMIIEGNVGIGTASPSQKLQIGDNSVAALGFRIAATGVNWDVLTDANGNLNMANGNGNYLTFVKTSQISSFTGNVGIGTTTPASSVKLTVVQSGSGDWEGIQIRSTAASGRTPLLSFINGDTYTNSISLSNNNNFAIAPSAGNVGIGTTTPTTAGLVISTNVSGVGIDVRNNRIQNVATPVNLNDAATREYVENYVGAAGGGTLKVYKSDGTTLLGTYAGYFSSGASVSCDNILYFNSSNNLVTLGSTPLSQCNTSPAAVIWYYTGASCTGNSLSYGPAYGCPGTNYGYNYGEVRASSGGCYLGTPATQRDPYTGACTDYSSGGPFYYGYNSALITRTCGGTGQCQVK